MKLYDAGLTVAIILIILSAYAAGVINWQYHCKPGGLEPKGCRTAQTETK